MIADLLGTDFITVSVPVFLLFVVVLILIFRR